MTLNPDRGFDAMRGAKTHEEDGLKFYFHSFVSFSVANSQGGICASEDDGYFGWA